MAETPLARLIREIIVTDGPVSVARFMDLCLGHPSHGYYMTRDPFGVSGDFTTAPEISQMFGELLGLWVAGLWQQMGCPEQVALVELGPGRGTLMADALRAARALPPFRAALACHLVEMSPVLQQAQHQRLAGSGVPTQWHRSIDRLPDDRPLIVIANEFFDALPVHQFVRQGGAWHERQIGLDAAGRFCFGLAGAAADVRLPDGQESDVRELCPQGATIVDALGRRLAAQGGALLAIDYGYARPAAGDTVQALRRHRSEDMLARPGEADLTAHVDFSALAAAGRRAGLLSWPLLTQGALLIRLGLGERAAALAASAPGRADEIEAACHRLAGPDAMGHLFKALCLTAPGMPAPPAFDTVDPAVAPLEA